MHGFLSHGLMLHIKEQHVLGEPLIFYRSKCSCLYSVQGAREEGPADEERANADAQVIQGMT